MKTSISRYVRLAAGIVAIGGLTAAGTVASAQNRDRLSQSDIRFMRDAARGGLAEVKLGELAVRRGASERVRQFGQRMVDDHSKANDELREIAIRKDVTLPANIGAEHRAMLDHLAILRGAAFDAAYIRHMRMDHAKDVSEFRREANAGRDPDVRRFASRTLPILRDHYAAVSAMSSRMRAHRMGTGRM